MECFLIDRTHGISKAPRSMSRIFKSNSMLRWLTATYFLFFMSSFSALAAIEKIEVSAQNNPPTLIAKNLSGQSVDITRFKGKVLLVNFWATWCAPCVREIPSLLSLQDQFGIKNLQLILINYGETQKKIQDFVEKNSIDGLILFDEGRTATANWNIKGLPTTFIIDRDFKLSHQALGELNWADETVTDLIESLISRSPSK
jgi:thiol-disulfide isomerase/thioredoxin